jgi:transketolase
MKKGKRKLEETATEVRQLVLEMACRSRSAHVGSSLSCVDLLVALYFSEMKIDEADWDNRDIFVLSKGHAAMALYATLAVKGLIGRKALLGYLKNNGTLPAHLDRFKAKGIEVSAGSLGHGFNVALGMAHGYRLKNDKRRVFALIGDGESEEGSIWEGALFASRLGVDNFTALLDYNNLQGYGRPRELCHYEPVIAKWKAFGWDAVRVDGHDFADIASALRRPRTGKPRIIVADTTKGKGVHFMEDEMKWHYFIVTDELREQAMDSLCGRPNEE